MKVKVIKEYVGRNSGLLHKVGATDEWSTVRKYGRALIENGFVEVIKEVRSLTKYEGVTYFPHRVSGKSQVILECKTDEDAIRLAGWLNARRVLLQDTKGFTPIWGKVESRNWSAYYDTASGTLVTNVCCNDNHGNIYFASEGEAEASIKAHEKEWKIFLGVE